MSYIRSRNRLKQVSPGRGMDSTVQRARMNHEGKVQRDPSDRTQTSVDQRSAPTRLRYRPVETEIRWLD